MGDPLGAGGKAQAAASERMQHEQLEYQREKDKQDAAMWASFQKGQEQSDAQFAQLMGGIAAPPSGGGGTTRV